MSKSSRKEFNLSRRESDLSSLREERAANAIPWSITPFQAGKDGEEMKELEPGETRVCQPEEVPWIDLLLEIAMTTAFAGLTDGTPILQWDNALSYVCFFAWVWWIWVAQVAYNMRFRQPDWFHKVMVFVQLIVFSAMAAFTQNFDITVGLDKDSDQAAIDALQAASGTNKNEFSASMFRNNRLPILNARGVSMAMGISRIVLLMQYSAVFYHARKQRIACNSLWAHILSLVFSAGCYFAAFGILLKDNADEDPSRNLHIIKLVLWYLPLVVEIVSHFVALRLPGFVGYTTEAIYARSGTVFLIILGAGLDKITGGFKSIVGNAGLGSDGIPIFISAAVIFIGFFSLYFATPGSNRELGSNRGLAWFFSQFFFLAALIVALQGIATAVSFTNLNSALLKVDDALNYVSTWQGNHMSANLTASDFPTSISLFNNLGIAFQDVVDVLNDVNGEAAQQGNDSIVVSGEIQVELQLFGQILEIFEAQPDPESLLSAKLVFLTNIDLTNTTTAITALTLAAFWDTLTGIVEDRGSSALWFYPSCGATILGLVLMSCVKGMPRDKFEWGVLGTRCIIGTATCFLAILSLGFSKPVYDSDGNLTASKIWKIAVGPAHLLLIIMAIIMGVVIIIENLFAYAANRSYHSFDSINFLDGPERRRTRREGPKYQRTYSVDTTDFELPATPYFDHQAGDYPYPNPYDDTHPEKGDAERTLLSST